MYAEFKFSLYYKAFGYKDWSVTDESLIYNKMMIPFSELTYFKLMDVPASSLTCGRIEAMYEGKSLDCMFEFARKDEVLKIVNFVSEKIEAAKGVEKDYKFKLLAHTGTTLEVYDSYVIINFMPTTILGNGSLGDKRINFADITSVQFREPAGMSCGFIQFAYPGSTESKGGVIDAINDENSVPIQPAMVEEARKIVKYIEKRRGELRNAPQGTVIQQASAADEIKKFKELLDMGVISQAEFDEKKKQLLGL